MTYEIEKLLKVYSDHGKIVVGVDFDDTIFPLTDNITIKQRSFELVDLLKEVQDKCILCLYTCADEQSLKYKVYIAESLGLNIEYVNESPLNKDDTKPFFNLLLDDKAGLNEAIVTLTEFKNNI